MYAADARLRLGPVLLDYHLGFERRFRVWRGLSRGYRLNVAVMLLSNPTLGVGAIAERCGYSSPEALSHALTTEGLPPPGELRRRILEGAG